MTESLNPSPPGLFERAPSAAAYRVLARAYRPQRLSELIGQEVLVRSLTNAIRTGRVAHAFLLTGIRGVGKTSTARIIARALNCIGPAGDGGPTPEPCGQCQHCRAIAEDRHIDVLEMDAATRTGIDDIREIVDSVRYAPTSARCKVYIIDEVHMLSEKAFNGLLKTLEEPPPQAKFVFATTEVRKLPVTILSRCQRFDLRRVDAELLVTHLAGIADKEGVLVEPAALALIAGAAEGSVRDALSLLDQATALAGGDGASVIDARQVYEMLGLADRARLLALFELVMRGDLAGSLAGLRELYDLGSEPESVVRDLLEICHWLTRLKVAPDAPGLSFGAAEAGRGEAMAKSLDVAVLARTWQMLLKGLDELRLAPEPLRAAEMLLVRIAYAADLPPPGALAKALAGEAGGPREVAAPSVAEAGAALAPDGAAPEDFPASVELFRQRHEPMLHRWLHDQVRLVRFAPGLIEVQAGGRAAPEWPKRAEECLSRWTGRPWRVSMVEEPGALSLGEQAAAAKRARIEALAGDPRLRPVLDGFPGARIVDVRAGLGDQVEPTTERP